VVLSALPGVLGPQGWWSHKPACSPPARMKGHPWVGAQALLTLSYRSCWLRLAYRTKHGLLWLLSCFFWSSYS